jgi:hypothetical protein
MVTRKKLETHNCEEIFSQIKKEREIWFKVFEEIQMEQYSFTTNTYRFNYHAKPGEIVPILGKILEDHDMCMTFD